MRFVTVICVLAAGSVFADNVPQIEVTSTKDRYCLGERAAFDVRITLPAGQSMRGYALFAMYPQPQPEYEVQLQKVTSTHYRYATPVFEEPGVRSLTVRLYRRGTLMAIACLEAFAEEILREVERLRGLLKEPWLPWWAERWIRGWIRELGRWYKGLRKAAEWLWESYVAEGKKKIGVVGEVKDAKGDWEPFAPTYEQRYGIVYTAESMPDIADIRKVAARKTASGWRFRIEVEGELESGWTEGWEGRLQFGVGIDKDGDGSVELIPKGIFHNREEGAG